MPETRPVIKKSKVVINLKGLRKITLIIFSFLLLVSLFFIYHGIKFAKKIEIFNNRITIGMEESEVIKLLGKPTYKYFHNSDERIAKLAGEKGEIYELIYSGFFALRTDIRLYFKKENNTLIFKERLGHTYIYQRPGLRLRHDSGLDPN